MSYSVDYDVIGYDEKHNSIARGSACYSGIYNKINDFKSILLYVPIKSDINSNSVKHSLDKIKQYNKILETADLKFTFNEELTDIGNKTCYSYNINVEDNSIAGVKLIMNFVRYLFEEEYPEIVTTILKIDNELPDLLPINKLILGHYSRLSWNGGHDIRGSYFYRLFKNNDEYLKWLKSHKGNINGNLPCIDNVDNKHEIIKCFSSGEVKKGYELYKSIEANVNILVYGSLRKGEYNYESYLKNYDVDDFKYIKTVKIRGYKLHSLGAYPGIKPIKDESERLKYKLTCDLLSVSKEVHNSIEKMELGANYSMEYNDYYKAYIYVYKGRVLIKNLIPEGDWSEYLKTKKTRINNK